MFALSNEETLHEFLFNKKIDEYDRQISDLEEQLEAFEEEYREIIEEES